MRHAHVEARDRGGQAQLCAQRPADCGARNERKSRTIRGSSLGGVQSVAPALAGLSVVRGTYGQNVAVATGDWAAAIDRKLAELKHAKKSC
jgi:hypothetical protein